jgi:flavin reductase (DIM6/NTAB) family NADH-FMN oxidoreductase RutF
MSGDADLALFKKAAGHFASGVTVVTTRNGDHLYGITCSSFISLSLNPLLVQVSVNSSSPFLDEVRASGRLAVSVLASGQERISQYFATRGRGKAVGEFPNVATDTVRTGAPVVRDCLSWFDASLHAILPGGDHQILIGEVVAAGGRDGTPLLYWAGRYRKLDPAERMLEDDPIGLFADAVAVQLHLSALSPQALLEAQHAIEPAAAELAATRRTPEGLAVLRAALAEAQSLADRPEQFTAAAMRFHDALGTASGNPALDAAIRALGTSRREHYASSTTPDTIDRTLRIHEQIFGAIVSGQAEQGRRLVVEHLTTVGRRLCGHHD